MDGRKMPAADALRRLATLHRQIEEAGDLARLLPVVSEAVRAISGSDVGLWLERDGRLHLTGNDTSPATPLPDGIAVGEGPVGHAFAQGLVSFEEPDHLRGAWLFAHLDVRDRRVGVLAARGPRRAWEDELRVLRSVVRALGTRLDIELADRLGLPGRPAILGGEAYMRRLAQEMSHAEASGYPLSLVIVRVRGYLDSDLLRRVGDLIRSVDECFITDLGEFAIVMPHTTGEEAAIGARRVAHVILSETPSGLGLSVGVAERTGLDPATFDAEARADVVSLRHPSASAPGGAA